MEIKISQIQSAVDAFAACAHTSQYRRIAVDSDGTVYFSENPVADEKQVMCFYAEHLEGGLDSCLIADCIAENIEGVEVVA